MLKLVTDAFTVVLIYVTHFVWYMLIGPVPIDSAEGERELEALKVQIK